jgi:hypothetical protein
MITIRRSKERGAAKYVWLWLPIVFATRILSITIRFTFTIRSVAVIWCRLAVGHHLLLVQASTLSL